MMLVHSSVSSTQIPQALVRNPH